MCVCVCVCVSFRMCWALGRCLGTLSQHHSPPHHRPHQHSDDETPGLICGPERSKALGGEPSSLFPETGFLCVALPVLELTVWARLALNSPR